MLSLTALAVLALAAPAPADAARPITVKLKRDDDKATVTTADGRTIVDITSPFGISTAVVERTADAWPDAVVVRLRLKGLEQFHAVGGKRDPAAVVKGGEDDGRVHLWVSGQKETLADPNSPYRMDLRMIGADGKPSTTIPLKDGYFEMRLPKPFFEGNPQTVTLSWIDFFRR